MYDTLVFIGRFQPFHKGHQAVIDTALQNAKELVIVIGSAYAARNIRNPLTYQERESLIRSVYPVDRYPNIHVVAVPDFPYNDQRWIKTIQDKVEACVSVGHNTVFFDKVSKAKVGLIGHSKDETSYYLKIFPNWGSVNVENFGDLNATVIREDLLDSGGTAHVQNKIFGVHMDKMPENAARRLYEILVDDTTFQMYPWYENMVGEYELIRTYKEAWEKAPYAPTFVTVDAVVTCSGHVLLVKRKESPGAGLWALPGGFLNQKETLQEGALRELKEETKIKVPLPVLRGSIIDKHTFDEPNRSTRGRTLTTAFYIDLGFEKRLPKVTGADDAEKAKWVSFNELKRDLLFEDHFSIIDYFINLG